MPWKMSSRASAATSTTLPMFAPSLETTASPVFTAVHAMRSSSSAIELIIDGRPLAPGPTHSGCAAQETVELGRLDRGRLPEDEQEECFASQTLRVLVGGNRAAAAGH